MDVARWSPCIWGRSNLMDSIMDAVMARSGRFSIRCQTAPYSLLIIGRLVSFYFLAWLLKYYEVVERWRRWFGFSRSVGCWPFTV